MIIVCPDCSAKFSVKSELFGGKGRKVKCSSCGYGWFQEPEGGAKSERTKQQDAVANSTDDGGKKSATKKKVKESKKFGKLPVPTSGLIVSKGKKASLFVTLAVFACFVLFVSGNAVVNALPFLESIYKFVGIYSTDKVKLSDVTLEKISLEGGGSELLIVGDISNLSDRDKITPNVKITLSAGGQHVRTIFLKSSGLYIETGQKIQFEQVVDSSSGELDSVAIDIGNFFELMLR